SHLGLRLVQKITIIYVPSFRSPPGNPGRYEIGPTTGSGAWKIRREDEMSLRQVLYSSAPAIGLAAFVAAVASPADAQQAVAVAIDEDDIGGVVTGANGPEAGVWVIAETTD